MIGIVIVSHSHKLAEGVRDLALQMTGDAVKIAAAGGIDDPENPIGTDPMRVMEAIETVYDGDSIVLLMDLGSALMSAEIAIEMIDPAWQPHVHLCAAPLVEGTVAAAVQASIGADVQTVIREAESALLSKQDHLGIAPVMADTSPTPDASATAQSLTITIPNPNGIHARPAAKIVSLAADFSADLTICVNNRTASAKSMSQIALLNAKQGDEAVFFADGNDANALLDALQGLAAEHFGDITTAQTPQSAPSSHNTDLPAAVIAGLSASGGFAVGKTHHFDHHIPTVTPEPITDSEAEIIRLDAAIQEAVSNLRDQVQQMNTSGHESESAIFEAHRLMLLDSAIQQPAYEKIRSEKVNAPYAWWMSVEALADAYRRTERELVQQRAQDVLDAGARVLRILLPTQAQSKPLPAGVILVAHDLTPSDTAQLNPLNVRGIATVYGGTTSHTAIIARSMGIPAVVGVGAALLELAEDETIALDGDRGWVYTAPSTSQIATFHAEIEARTAKQRTLIAASRQPAITTDQRQIDVAANVGAPADCEPLIEQGAEGVGLFRTELLFMGRDAAPTEEEQIAAYTAAAQHLNGHPVIIRTLDIGGDKPVRYLPTVPEDNPFLGYRGVRYWLGNPDLAQTQLRAICRASADHNLKLMFPMIGTVDEFIAARALLREVQASLYAKGIAYDHQMEVGIMIEVPSAVLGADQLARLVDFASIGTNDLTQYLMAADRGNPQVASLANPFQPGVLRAIQTAVAALHAAGKWVGMCGEMAGNPLATRLLIGMGLDELSMSAPSIPQVKALIRKTSYAEAQTIAQTALTLATADEVIAYLKGVSGEV